MTPAIAIVGMACRYPDASSPGELWENVLAQRQAFRRMPPERLRLADYFSEDRQAPDRMYATEAALLEGYEFDRVAFRVAGSTFRSADLTHWLALHVAAEALADAGFPDGNGLPREATGVLLGNTLTGEFSRAGLMRLRWPYVRRQVGAALIEAGWEPQQRGAFLDRLEHAYKGPFAPVGEETLAGGLANTIAGRICNHFDLKGGGYTVDGACASSLLAIVNACAALLTGDLDVVIAGGVDLSLDPFELVGFAKTGALAEEKMRVYDARSAGFWPGEGSGMVVLMRQTDALAEGRRIYALIRGWGVSSDGSGGITRPEVEGQLLAVQRAYRRAGFGIETVGYFEGHGTGTSVGDATELRTLARARQAASPDRPPAAIGSVKANIGHTKAAAGAAGLIKTTMALATQILPPTTGCETPHPELAGPALRMLNRGELWPADQPLRAGVSAMGFGGINTHIVLEAPAQERRAELSPAEHVLLASAQDAELFLLSVTSPADLQRSLAQVAEIAPKLSRAELADLAGHLEHTCQDLPVRAAIVAGSAAELASGLDTLQNWLAAGRTTALDTRAGVFLGEGARPPRIGFLFPGQGSPVYLDGGAVARRFPFVETLYTQVNLPAGDSGISTMVAQPAIVTASLAALRTLEHLGVRAGTGLGHSLGELTALHWAGAIDEAALLQTAAVRGRAMAELGSPTGAMASIAAGRRDVEWLLNGDAVTIACLNSPRQTVISGAAPAVAAVVARATERGLTATTLPVSHAFHSPLVAAAADPLAAHLAGVAFQPLQHTVVSTITGAPLAPDAQLRALLHRQVTAPVRFVEAVIAADSQVDLWIEAGPGRVLCGLVSEFLDVPAIALDAGGPALLGLLRAAGAAFALGAPLRHAALFEGRFTRPITLDWRPRFLVNPCELAPIFDDEGIRHDLAPSNSPGEDAGQPTPETAGITPLDLLRQLVAERAEIPLATVRPGDHLLSDLHLNSIAVSQLVAEAARRLNLAPPAIPSDFANTTVAEAAEALERLRETGTTQAGDEAREPAGVAAWIRAFTVELVEQPLRQLLPAEDTGAWEVLAQPGHPLAEPLRVAFAHGGAGGGIVLCMPLEQDEQHVGLLLQGAQAALKGGAGTRFVLVQQGGAGAAVARTLHLEAPRITVCVVDLPFEHPRAAEWVLAEALAAEGYAEVHYDRAGRRHVPLLRLLPAEYDLLDLPLGPNDVLLVTGGGKGITAECALALARESGARLALLGRSQPDADADLAANLARLAALGIIFRYVATDITDPDAVRAAIGEIEAGLGPITSILHGAARNEPRLLAALNEAAIQRTLAPKIAGLRNILAAIDPERVRLLVSFGSIIARTGLPGEADYGLANEWLTRMTEQFQAEYPACRCLAVEWSVWADVGMGARLGQIESLMRQGITPIPPDEGIAILRRLLTQPSTGVAVVVTGRYGAAPTLRVEQPDLPFLRFLERPRVYYPGVELIVEADLSAGSDPYLEDHIFRGERLFPAVMGMEAMAQAATALIGTDSRPIFEEVHFIRPIVLPPDGSITIRLVALAHTPNLVEVALRSAETAFQVDHFRARCRVGEGKLLPGDASTYAAPFSDSPPIGLAPERDLYGSLLFHSGRFRRLRGYRRLAARGCVAEVAADPGAAWFSQYLPAALLLGDPGSRDATIHAIQSCVPHMALLPIGVERLTIAGAAGTGPALVHAQERLRDGDTFIYDVAVYGPDGGMYERWEGLHLRVVSGATFGDVWVEPLLGPYVERRIQELIPGAAVAVALERDIEAERHANSDLAIRHVLGETITIWRRPDGKPEVASEHDVSIAHASNLTLALAGTGPLACDIEPVVARPTAVWQDVLGPERFALAGVIAQEQGEDLAAAATRVWAAGECLKKAGALPDAPLMLTAAAADRWIVLASGPLAVATFIASVRGSEHPVVIAALVPNRASQDLQYPHEWARHSRIDDVGATLAVAQDRQ